MIWVQEKHSYQDLSLTAAGGMEWLKALPILYARNMSLMSCYFSIDSYRSGDVEDIDLFDLDRDIKKQKIILIEWPEKLFSERKPDVEIYLEHAKEMRESFC